jgi:single-stranded-DNA-specific exonuclease
MKWIQRQAKKKFNDDDLIIDKLAKIRGIYNLNEWINPPKKFVHSPYTLDNIDEAVQKIIHAVGNKLKIVVVADIDTDGVCSTGIMYNYLKTLTKDISYIHAQRSEGHGVEKVIDKIEEDVHLVLIVDSSSNSVEGCKLLKEMGKEVVIIDHHIMDTHNPYALIVNCQQGGYANKDLSGSAMCYKVCQVLDEYLDLDMADDFLDLTAVGLVGDMMSVWNMENRYLIYNGINKIDNLGIKEILNQSNIDYKDGITSTNISFKIAPIIGACSRFDRIELALELVTTDDVDRAKELTKIMIEMNENRKKEQKGTVEEIVKGIEVREDDTKNNIIVIISNDIDSGFRGLVATEIVEVYSKPVFVVSRIEDKKTKKVKYGGSARSVGVIPLKSMCEDSGYFNFATGHEQAFGVEFTEENFENIIKYFNENLEADDLQKVVEYDLELHVDDIDDMDIKQVEKFSKIVGQGFSEPKFKIKGIIVDEKSTKKLGSHVRAVMGKNLDTVKINCEGDFALMRFRTNEKYAEDIHNFYYSNFITELTVVGSLNLNKFYNFGTKRTEITKQVFLEDYKIVD